MIARGFFRLSNLEVAFIIVFSTLVLTQIFTTIGTFSTASSATSDYEVTVRVAGLPATYYTNITVDGKFSGGIKGDESKAFRFDTGTSHTIAVEEHVNEGAETRYYCPSNTRTFSTEGSYTFVYTPQFYLTINVIPKGILFLWGAGWYDKGSEATYEHPPIKIYGTTGTRYHMFSWAVDGVEQEIGTLEQWELMPEEQKPPSVIMHSPHKVVVRYGTQYFLTVESAYGNTTGSGWYDSGSFAIFNVTSPLPTGGFLGMLGVKRVFDHWTGDSNAPTPEATVLMDAPKKVTATWRVDYTPIYTLTGIVAAVVIASGVIGVRYRKAHPSPALPSTPQKAYCKYCGAERPVEAPYCPKCGKKQSA